MIAASTCPPEDDSALSAAKRRQWKQNATCYIQAKEIASTNQNENNGRHHFV